MPQIWMTYDELATLSGCSAAEARVLALHLSLDRRKSRDGNTRVKLDLALTARFFASFREAEFDLDERDHGAPATPIGRCPGFFRPVSRACGAEWRKFSRRRRPPQDGGLAGKPGWSGPEGRQRCRRRPFAAHR